jgi:hypothetical protein
MAAFASFPVRAASDKAAALSANTGVPIISKQHIVAKALAMESSLKVVPQRIQLLKVGFRTALGMLKNECYPSHRRTIHQRHSETLMVAAPFWGLPQRARLKRNILSVVVISRLRRRTELLDVVFGVVADLRQHPCVL